ncbi:MAG: MerR family transcriptional regulator [Candidatus Komeilibacteria bacterium]|nr:MerR family transcriptional regulator [Candidatus Komeilibacteria bacterium]
MKDIINISQAAAMLGLNIQTLRRWDISGELSAKRDASGRLFYYQSDLEDFLKANSKYFLKTAEKWARAKNAPDLPNGFYCPDRSVFKARLSRFESDLKNNPLWQKNYSLIVAIAGEIGNNSFDHNLGNWPDVLGIFFGYILKERTVILADRGQGILATLRRVAPDLTTHQGALKAAFTEILSGRAPENRGNGLKFVKQVVQDNDFSLFFQSGDATLLLNNKNKDEALSLNTGDYFLRGCFAKLNF